MHRHGELVELRSMKIIDSHMHCGVQNSDLPFETVKHCLEEGNIQGACLYAPVEDVYDRYNYHFQDTPRWVACRQLANEYLLDVQRRSEGIFAYYFVWNDFRREELKKGYRGVKWHRHTHEPTYNYDDPRCEAFLEEVYRLQIPIVLEESFENTRYFIRRVAGRTPVIIPHMGGLNGGFAALFHGGVWDDDSVYADTALASEREIAVFLKRYGSGRLLFGSDFPFGMPYSELRRVKDMNLKGEDLENIVCRNILRLMKANA
jgi:predicted TIM-barrel fold metal-dependent hydrolase